MNRVRAKLIRKWIENEQKMVRICIMLGQNWTESRQKIKRK